ncbi:MAG: hypothetical protein ACFFCE_01460 [Promethearchaeota archaeon]
MKRKNIIIISILCLFLMVSMASAAIGRADLKLSTADNITDATGDIIEINGNEETWTSTDLHTEVDIATMTHSGQNFTITFSGNVPTTASYIYTFILYEDIDDPTTQYMVMYGGGSGGYLINPSGLYWTGTDWGYMTPASVVTIDGDEFEIGIPSGALTIDSSLNWYFMSMYLIYATNMSYVDICPDSLQSAALKGISGPGGNGIPGYELTILIGITCVASFVCIYTYKKRIKK